MIHPDMPQRFKCHEPKVLTVF
uniref:Uncharacterized protein n=1 Tax=Arundo donax TaxID=35708 RepID=A0A0A9ADX0_ARUDO